MSKLLISESRFLGAVADCAVQQSPYHRPDNLELVLDKLHENLGDFFKSQQLGFAEFDNGKAVITFVRNSLRAIPEYVAWNDRKNGNDAPLKFTSRYDGSGDPDDDFIDLDALEMNVCEILEAEA